MDIAERLGYLSFPFVPEGQNELFHLNDAEQLVLWAWGHAEGEVLAVDIGDALRHEWKLSFSDDTLFEAAFTETCLVAVGIEVAPTPLTYPKASGTKLAHTKPTTNNNNTHHTDTTKTVNCRQRNGCNRIR